MVNAIRICVNKHLIEILKSEEAHTSENMTALILTQIAAIQEEYIVEVVCLVTTRLLKFLDWTPGLSRKGRGRDPDPPDAD